MFIKNLKMAIIAKWFNKNRRFCAVLLFENNQI